MTKNPCIWVLIWEHSSRAIQWIPTWQGLDGFQRFLRSCAFDESSLSIGRVKTICAVLSALRCCRRLMLGMLYVHNTRQTCTVMRAVARVWESTVTGRTQHIPVLLPGVSSMPSLRARYRHSPQTSCTAVQFTSSTMFVYKRNLTEPNMDSFTFLYINMWFWHWQ